MKALILAGGKGTRLWPLSREKYSKQFLTFINGKSLLEATYERVLNLLNPDDIITITNKDYYFYVKDIYSRVSGSLEKNIICEPTGRNTCPAIALGVQYALEELNLDLNEVFYVFPSDHIIYPTDRFTEYMKVAESACERNYLVTFGIKPDRPETGYGYIKVGKSLGNFNMVDGFKEKPSLEVAKEYLKEGNYLWNSGMFAFRASLFLEELKAYQIEIYNIINKGYKYAVDNFHFMPNISIDYAIAERTKRVVVIPMEIFWSDVGSWESFYEISQKDDKGNVLMGDVCAINTKNSLILSNKRLVAAVGIEDSMVIETDDAVLISKKGNGQEVKNVLEILSKANRKEILEHTEVYRPWGYYKTLEKGDSYKIRRVIIKPRESLTLHLHKHRSEHWTVLNGNLSVQIGEKHYHLSKEESIFASKGTLHRLYNCGIIPVEFIEIQTGKIIEEEDIEVHETRSE